MSATTGSFGLDPGSGRARDRIIAAAEQCIDRGEIGRTKVNELADAAGVHRVTFYRHFPDKESLVFAVLDQRSAPVFEHFATTLLAGEFFLDRLIDAMVSAIAEVRATPGLLAALGLYPTDEAPHSAATSRRFLQRATDIAAPHLRSAQSAGFLRTDLPIEEMIEWLLHQCLATLLLKPGDTDEQTRRQLTQFIVPAIEARPA